MKYCSHCGREVLDDAVICPGCGCSVRYDGAGAGNGFSKPNGVPQQQPIPPYADNYSGLSVAGLILSFISPLIGLILSIVAHNEAKRTGSLKTASMSKAGIIVSSVFLGIVAIIVLIYIIAIVGLIFM